MLSAINFTSLRSRLLLLIIAILVMTALATMWLASRAVTQRFHDYLVSEENASRDRREQLEKLLPVILDSLYDHSGNLKTLAHILQQFGDLSGERIVLEDNNGKVLLDTASKLKDQPAYQAVGGTVFPIEANGETLGRITLLAIVSTQPSRSQQRYIAEINEALLWAVAGTAIFAIGLTLLMTRGILNPVEAVTRAVNRMKQGDMGQRVMVTTSDEIGDLARAFNSMADGLENAELLRRNMVSDVAHELRTPLSNIRGYLEAMQDGVVEASPATIRSLHEEALFLHRLVEDLQLLALAEAGHLPLVRQPVAVGEIVEKAIQTTNNNFDYNDIRLTAHIQPGLPAVLADGERISQVLRNLLSNAFSYTPPKGIITVSAHRLNNSVQVSIYNSGSGIAPEHLPFLFERFYRADRSRTRATGGSGLGLAIVRQLVQAHGGIVWADSIPGEFARFNFTLPMAGA